MSLKSLFESVDPKGELFSEAVITGIEQALAARIDEKVQETTAILVLEHSANINQLNEAHALLVEQKLQEQDSEHAAVIESLVESIDKSHTEKLKEIADMIDKNYADKITTMKESMDVELKEKVSKVRKYFKDKHESNLVEAVSKYVDGIIDEVIPKSASVDKVKLERYENIYTDMRKRLLVTDSFVQGEVKEAVMEAKAALDDRDKKINELMTERTELDYKLQKMEAGKLLESKLVGMDDAQAAYLRKFFEHASHVTEITTKLNEAVSAYESTKRRERDILVEETKTKQPVVKSVIPSVVIPSAPRSAPVNTESDSLSVYIKKSLKH